MPTFFLAALSTSGVSAVQRRSDCSRVETGFSCTVPCVTCFLLLPQSEFLRGAVHEACSRQETEVQQGGTESGT